ncbi:MAG: ArsR/SmtB family transcription factor [Spirochaetota bacterium]
MKKIPSRKTKERYNPAHFLRISTVREKLLEEEMAIRISDFFRVFGDTTRIKILNALFLSELCVNDIAALLGMGQSAVSHQLRILKSSGLVKKRREGKTIFYSLNDEHIKQIFHQSLDHLTEH